MFCIHYDLLCFLEIEVRVCGHMIVLGLHIAVVIINI